MLKANKGEWSELYAFLKIMNDREVPAADSRLRPLNDKSYRFVKLFREDDDHRLEYDLSLQDRVSIHVLGDTQKPVQVISTEDLGGKTRSIFNKLTQASSPSFEVREAEEEMANFKISKIKAKSTEKTDLDAAILDPMTDDSRRLGFSIKSQIGSAPTLLNSSAHTNFVFQINGFTGTLDEVNSMETTRERINTIIESEGSFQFESITSAPFTSNIRLIDSNYSSILAQMILDHYSGRTSSVVELADYVGESNEYGFTKSEVAYKTKNFLRAVALGMVPSKVWDTYLSTYGGYIIVKENGELVCYHLYNDDDFKDYLYANTKLESPSRTRHNYGTVYEDEGRLKMNLNLQIRFNK